MSDAPVVAQGSGVKPRPPAAFRRIVDRPELPPLVFLLLMSAILALTTNGFAAAGNLMGIAQQAAPIVIVALAVNQLVIAGQIESRWARASRCWPSSSPRSPNRRDRHGWRSP